MGSPLLFVKDLDYAYKTSAGHLPILTDLSFAIESGESVALVGPSGCGKSTLLHLIGLLDIPQKGHIQFQEQTVSGLQGHERTRIRLGNMGFIYQHHSLLPEFSALENVMMPMWIAQKYLKISSKELHSRAVKILGSMGLADRLHHYPSQLSGGQQQRVAVARALVHNPPLIIADEPTGNLDPGRADETADLLLANVKESQSSLLMATHNLSLAQKCSRICTIQEGTIARLDADKL